MNAPRLFPVSDPGMNAYGMVKRDPQPTSEAAARAVEPRSGTQRLTVLELIREAGERGLTDEELSRLTGWSGNTVRPRRGELVRDGWVVASDLRRSTPQGHAAIVWIAAH